MKTVYLHIGAHKTGSTAVQNFFSLNRDKLIEKGILYPKFSRHQDLPHHVILRPLVEPRINDHIWSFPNSEHIGSIDSIRALLKEEEEASQCDSLLISTEFLFVNKPIFGNIVCGVDFADYVKELFSGYKVKPIVYLRNQCDWIESCYVEAVKGAHTCYCGSFDEYFFENIEALDYRQYLEPWVKQFGNDLIVRCYENNKEKGVERDLINILGLSWGEREFLEINSSSSNVGLSKAAVEIIRAFNYLNSTRNEGEKYIFPYTNEVLEKKGYFGKEGYLKKEQCIKIYKDFYEGNSEIEKISSQDFLDSAWRERLEMQNGPNDGSFEMLASAELIKDLCESRLRFDSVLADNERKIEDIYSCISGVDKKIDSLAESSTEENDSLACKLSSLEKTIEGLGEKIEEGWLEKMLKLLGRKGSRNG